MLKVLRKDEDLSTWYDNLLVSSRGPNSELWQMNRLHYSFAVKAADALQYPQKKGLDEGLGRFKTFACPPLCSILSPLDRLALDALGNNSIPANMPDIFEIVPFASANESSAFKDFHVQGIEVYWRMSARGTSMFQKMNPEGLHFLESSRRDALQSYDDMFALHEIQLGAHNDRSGPTDSRF
jgi:hypothetical protein